jgi:NAD(P)-dependent dehydrogenase (short-subunit alcohol dehydrogenase family)
VIAHGRDPGRGAELVAEIAARGGRARFIAADLSDAAEVTRLAAEADPVDILVNNAGVWDFAATPATSADMIDRHLAVNTRAPFLLVGALAPGMAHRGRGAIVNISSTAATWVAPIGAVYGASKAALDMLTRNWATEFGPHGVRVNAVSPAAIRTDGTELMFGGNMDAFDSVTLRGRAGEPVEIAEAVLFLVEDRSSYINGAVLAAHGGERSLLPS